MSKLFHEFQVATKDDCQFAWSGVPNGKEFFCAFCRHRFVPGDEYRAVYTNDLKGAGGNPLTCRGCFVLYCGLGGLRTRWQELWKEWRELIAKGGKFAWWGLRNK